MSKELSLNLIGKINANQQLIENHKSSMLLLAVQSGQWFIELKEQSDDFLADCARLSPAIDKTTRVRYMKLARELPYEMVGNAATSHHYITNNNVINHLDIYSALEYVLLPQEKRLLIEHQLDKGEKPTVAEIRSLRTPNVKKAKSSSGFVKDFRRMSLDIRAATACATALSLHEVELWGDALVQIQIDVQECIDVAYKVLNKKRR